ncbi:hypothetical protein M378DRAFT_191067 [Amanita muscaria Koide BX008]|uniref:Sister chromatid cohesion protein DCC1 n=1 Tax=Amanita muscaria (strain Koide BX008) TaxID=946122 RepID=A0A0C2TLR3_AMAMK|nr:hypothetical protein M378DRAFT_191067 [Amanita muscaria Koide BX008]
MASTSDIQLNFSQNSLQEAGSYKLLELPSDLCNLVESSLDNATSLSLSIKGQENEEAVLCTQDRTYTVRSVVLSNTILIVKSSDSGGNSVDIRDQVNNILELAPCVPKLQKLDLLLRGKIYDENLAGMEIDSETTVSGLSIPFLLPRIELRKGTGLTYEQAKLDIQASDEELIRALKDRRILVINGELRPITPGYLLQILELVLTILVSLSLPHDAAPVDELSSILANDHEVSQTVTKQIIAWFGEVEDDKWKMDVRAVVGEMGLNLLREHRREPIAEDLLLTKWKSCVGDTFQSAISLDLLSGNYIKSNENSVSECTMLTYFPASALSADPAARFAHLFLARPRWKGDEISPFLNDIAVDKKERDKLLLKYCRAIIEAGSVWYTSRAQYNI